MKSLLPDCLPRPAVGPIVLSLLLMGFAVSFEAVRADDIVVGIRAPDGFEVTLYADNDLAPDIYSLTVDSIGRVVVSSRGYVRILVDGDNDGTADSYEPFVDGPANGAMGMYWEGRDLLCTGDAGLLRYRDENGDDRADADPDVLLAARTGGEHDIHAIRKGPDGDWYLLGGNGAELDERYVTLPTSPVQHPQAGALVRLSADFQTREVIADGFRNPYDFAFAADGRAFTYDSDGERDVSLPWYRPTRVFEIVPGAHAGWISRSWKRPGYFIDMPPVVAAFGRGSPTGVECYRHTQFPQEYRGGLFVLDWTYGRMMHVPRVDDEGQPTAEPEEFLTGAGTFGFAPTDAAVGTDGSLFVSVGGRGTRGGVYRIRWKDNVAELPEGTALEEILNAPQPLSSWSRAKWEPLLDEIMVEDLAAAARDEQRPSAQRTRAIEILCEKFESLDQELAADLLNSPVAAVRARTAWSLGRQGNVDAGPLLAKQLADDSSSVVRAAAEALLSLIPATPEATAIAIPADALLAGLSTRNRAARLVVARLLARLDAATIDNLAGQLEDKDHDALLTLTFARILHGDPVDAGVIPALVSVLGADVTLSRKLDAVRLLQLALGDVGPGDRPPVYDGYAIGAPSESAADSVEQLRFGLSQWFPVEDTQLNHELARLVAILQPDDVDVLANVLSQLTPTSHPVADVHFLIAASRLDVQRTPPQTESIAGGLLAIDEKIETLGLNRDSNWDDRIGEMVTALVRRDPHLPAALIAHKSFGRPGHVTFTAGLSEKLQAQAIDAFASQIATDPDYHWNSDIVRLLGESGRDDVRELLRNQAGEFAVGTSVLLALAKTPQLPERALFVNGLQVGDVGVLRTLVQALAKLGPSDDAAEQVALVRTLRRVGSNTDSDLQADIIKLLEQNNDIVLTNRTGTDDPRQAQQELTLAWTEWAREQHPDEWAAQSGVSAVDADALQQMLADVDWTTGDRGRGEAVFLKRGCSECHGGRRALGPDLSGVARRFSRDDLFAAIALPDRDVSPRYQTTLIVTDDGQAHTGIVIYESIDGLLLRNSRGETLRIEAEQIDVRRQLTSSLMPGGLLKDLQPADLADLYVYLLSLQ